MKIHLNLDQTFEGPFTHDLPPADGQTELEISPQQYAQLMALDRDGKAVRYQGGVFTTMNIVPAEISLAQLREGLRRDGLFASVQAVIDGLKAQSPIEGDVMQEWFDHAPAVRRDNAKVLSLASALGLTASDLDEKFVRYSKFN